MTSPETERLSSITGWCQTLVIFGGLFFARYCMFYSFFLQTKKKVAETVSCGGTACMCLVTRCGSKVTRRQEVGRWGGGEVGAGECNNLSVSQVHFPRVCVVLHTSHAAVHVCIRPETTARQLPHFKKEEQDDIYQTLSTWGAEGPTLWSNKIPHKLKSIEVFLIVLKKILQTAWLHAKMWPNPWSISWTMPGNVCV